MRRLSSGLATGAAITSILAGCGGGSDAGSVGGGPPPTQSLTSFLGTTGVFVASVDPTSGNYQVAPTGSYAGKRQ